MPDRSHTRQVKVGHVAIGGGAPISVQTMTTVPAARRDETLEQIRRVAEAGCDLVRLAVPTREDTAALPEILAASPIPLIADVHFHCERALEAIASGVPKVRLNPGNIRQRSKVERVIAAAREAGTVIRVGVNSGSVRARTGPQKLADRRRELIPLMLERMSEYVAIFEQNRFESLVLAAKCPDAPSTLAVYRLLADRFDYPLHLGLTHAGPPEEGALRTAVALAPLLAEGIGDTLRVSLTADPVAEVRVGLQILWELGLRPRGRPRLISCPTCGRCEVDLVRLVSQVEDRLGGCEGDFTVAVMGCVVNGPGEAAEADIGLAVGGAKAVLFASGDPVRTVGTDAMLEALFEEIARRFPGSACR